MLKVVPRASLAASTSADGTIYAIGGRGDTAEAFVKMVEAYHPATNTWTSMASAPPSEAILAPPAGIAAPNGAGEAPQAMPQVPARPSAELVQHLGGQVLQAGAPVGQQRLGECRRQILPLS